MQLEDRGARSEGLAHGMVKPRLRIAWTPRIGNLCYIWLKRMVDVVLAMVLLLVLAPLLALIALAIRLDSPGPVIFTQERAGCRWRDRRRCTFKFHKFRSMIHDCDQRLHVEHVRRWARGDLQVEPGDTAGFKLVADPRVTRVGRWLRRTSLDELPQLWNVLTGSMSLVGPRPVPDYEVAEYAPWHFERLSVPPGITGLWQVEGRGQVSLDEMAELDIAYVRRRSLGLDIALLIRTLPAVLSGKGAR